MHEATSNHIDGISDLVVVAPIKPGFINAFENVTYATRLKLVAEALNRVRISARESQRIQPYTDVTERILNLLDFRIGVLDKDMFGLAGQKCGWGPNGTDGRFDGSPTPNELHLEPRRYLYLTATFEGGWEPYMRLIWRPLGAFLDLLLCNCEDYVTAAEHSFEEYIQWVRDNQIDAAIFYSTTGLTVRDQRYLSRLERLERKGGSDLDLAKLTMAYPDDDADGIRKTLAYAGKTIELGLEAMTVLYKLADYYPPEWMTGPIGDPDAMAEGHRLVRVAAEILRGWDSVIPYWRQKAEEEPDEPVYKSIMTRWNIAEQVYAEPLQWYLTGKLALARRDQAAAAEQPKDPHFTPKQVQGGILKPFGSKEQPVRWGALLMFTVREADGSRKFIKALLAEHKISFNDAVVGNPVPTLFRTVAMTARGMLQLGMAYELHDRLPKEFRDGPALRSGLVGDMRENHPRNWILPERNGPLFIGTVPSGTKLPPVEMDEIDIVIQLRSTDADRMALEADVRALAAAAGAAVTLEAIDWMHADYDATTGRLRDHFGFVDGISQPRPKVPKHSEADGDRDRVALGEVLIGYGNDRGDARPMPFTTLDAADKPGQGNTHWRNKWRKCAIEFQHNSSFLVIRKIGMEVDELTKWLDGNKHRIANELGITVDAARGLLKAKMLGRNDRGCPLVPQQTDNLNDFDYAGDQQGIGCPHAAHIRKANPRRIVRDDAAPVETRAEFNRPTPRLLRRGMLFGGADTGARGLMFMAYAGSIAEQYEVIQRWLNGGNSTDVAAAEVDPLTGVQPAEVPDTFRFVAQRANADGSHQPVVVRVPLPPVKRPLDQQGEPGRHPFTPLYWGLYLFVPSRGAIETIVGWTGRHQPLREMKEKVIGSAWIEKLMTLSPEEAGKEWKQLIEDFGAKDPTERDISPNLWSAIRWRYGGALNLKRWLYPGPVPAPPAASVAGPIPWMGLIGLKGLFKRFASTPRVAAAIEPVPTTRKVETDPPYDWGSPIWRKQNVIICAGRRQVMQVLAQWDTFTSEEQLRRIRANAGPIYVTQQPDNDYNNPVLQADGLDYHAESLATNTALLAYEEADAFKDGYAAGKAVLEEAKHVVEFANSAGTSGKRNYFKIELRRQYFQPAIAELWKHWYGLPDETHMHAGGWSWKRIVAEISESDPADQARTGSLCPGDFLSPSRASVYPRPSKVMQQFGEKQGTAILESGRRFVSEHYNDPSRLPPLAQKLFKATPDPEVLARNLIGTMIGAIPPMDANLRNILFEWLLEKDLWRVQALFKRAVAGNNPAVCFEAINAILRGPMSRAICKRPAPDILYRTAKKDATIKLYDEPKQLFKLSDVKAKEGDLLIVSLVSASQRSFEHKDTPDGDVSIVFGGKRVSNFQGYKYENGKAEPDPEAKDENPVHACPGMNMAMGAMTGILAALLDSGTIQALPASLIVKISDWQA